MEDIYGSVSLPDIPSRRPQTARVIVAEDGLKLVDWREDAAGEGLALLLSSFGIGAAAGAVGGPKACFDLDEMRRRNVVAQKQKEL